MRGYRFLEFYGRCDSQHKVDYGRLASSAARESAIDGCLRANPGHHADGPRVAEQTARPAMRVLRSLRPRHDGAVAPELTPFLALHFRGARFDADAGMPVETLGELVAYRELVTEVARLVFLGRHPDRQRVPKGFTDRLSLRLREIGEGSSVPLLERPSVEGLLLINDEFDTARDLISEAIEAAGSGQAIPKGFPSDALVHFNRLGQGLYDNESIELRAPNTETGPRYTQQVRKALLSGRSNYQRDATIVGWVTELDAERMRFHLRRSDGSIVPAPIDVVTFDEVKEALAPSGEGPQVSVSGVGVFDRTSDQLVRFDSVHELMAEDTEESVEDLIAASTVQAGWLDDDGDATDPEVLQRTTALLDAIFLQGGPAPRVFPVPDGGMQAEWTLGDREISVTVEPGGSLYVIEVNVVSGDAKDETVADDDVAAVLRLVVPDAS